MIGVDIHLIDREVGGIDSVGAVHEECLWGEALHVLSDFLDPGGRTVGITVDVAMQLIAAFKGKNSRVFSISEARVAILVGKNLADVALEIGYNLLIEVELHDLGVVRVIDPGQVISVPAEEVVLSTMIVILGPVNELISFSNLAFRVGQMKVIRMGFMFILIEVWILKGGLT